MPELVAIYALCDPVSGEIRYIGKANNPEKRFLSHLREKRRSHYPVYCWLAALQKRGQLPKLKVLRWCDSDWQVHEKALIATYPNLLNVAEGGDEPSCSRETRAANGKKVADLIHGDPKRKRIWEMKMLMSQSLKQGHCSETVKEKLRYCAKKRPDLFGCWVNV